MEDRQKRYVQTAVAIYAELGKKKALRVADTGSMYPLLDHTCRIHMAYTSVDNIDIGDIIVFYTHSGHLVAHRVLQKHTEEGKGMIYQKGDSGIGLPNAIWPHRIVGKIVSVHRPNGSMLDLTTEKATTLYRTFARACTFAYRLPVVRRSILHSLRRRKGDSWVGIWNRAKYQFAEAVTHIDLRFRYHVSWIIMKLLRQ
jgi:hypothetical protein